MVVDRATQRVVPDGELRRRNGHRGSRGEARRRRSYKVFIDPAKGLTDAEADDVARKIGIPEASVSAGAHDAAGAVPRVRRDRRVARRDQSADRHRRRPRDRARRQAQLRLQRALPPSRTSSRCAISTRRIRPRSRRRSSTCRTSRSTATSAACVNGAGLAMATMDTIKLYGGDAGELPRRRRRRDRRRR